MENNGWCKLQRVIYMLSIIKCIYLMMMPHKFWAWMYNSEFCIIKVLCICVVQQKTTINYQQPTVHDNTYKLNKIRISIWNMLLMVNCEHQIFPKCFPQTQTAYNVLSRKHVWQIIFQLSSWSIQWWIQMFTASKHYLYWCNVSSE